MANFLYRLGRLAFRRRWYVAVMWVAVLGAVGFGAATAPAAPDDGFTMPGIESQRAFDLLRPALPRRGGRQGPAPGSSSSPRTGRRSRRRRTGRRSSGRVTEVASGSQVAGAVAPFQAQRREQGRADRLRDRRLPGDGRRPHRRQQEGSSRTRSTQARAAGLTVEVGGDALATKPRRGRGSGGHRHRHRRGRAADHLRVAGRRRAAAADRDPRCRHQHGLDPGPGQRVRAVGRRPAPWPRCWASPAASTTPCSSCPATARNAPRATRRGGGRARGRAPPGRRSSSPGSP